MLSLDVKLDFSVVEEGIHVFLLESGLFNKQLFVLQLQEHNLLLNSEEYGRIDDSLGPRCVDFILLGSDFGVKLIIPGVHLLQVVFILLYLPIQIIRTFIVHVVSMAGLNLLFLVHDELYVPNYRFQLDLDLKNIYIFSLF